MTGLRQPNALRPTTCLICVLNSLFSRWAYLFNYRLGVYVRLTSGFYIDAAFTGLGHIFNRLPQKYISSQFPFGFSMGLRFGRERR